MFEHGMVVCPKLCFFSFVQMTVMVNLRNILTLSALICFVLLFVFICDNFIIRYHLVAQYQEADAQINIHMSHNILTFVRNNQAWSALSTHCIMSLLQSDVLDENMESSDEAVCTNKRRGERHSVFFNFLFILFRRFFFENGMKFGHRRGGNIQQSHRK